MLVIKAVVKYTKMFCLLGLLFTSGLYAREAVKRSDIEQLPACDLMHESEALLTEGADQYYGILNTNQTLSQEAKETIQQLELTLKNIKPRGQRAPVGIYQLVDCHLLPEVGDKLRTLSADVQLSESINPFSYLAYSAELNSEYNIQNVKINLIPKSFVKLSTSNQSLLIEQRHRVNGLGNYLSEKIIDIRFSNDHVDIENNYYINGVWAYKEIIHLSK